MNPLKIIPCIFVLSLSYSQAAVIAIGDLATTVSSYSENSTVDKDPDPDVDQKDLLNAKGDDIGEVIAGVFNESLFTSGSAPTDFLVEADFIEASVSRDVNSGPPVMAAADTLFEITFEIEPGEEGTLALDFDYAMENLGISSTTELVWSLSGPVGEDVSAFEGSFLVANGDAALSDSVSQTSSTLGSGVYTFSLAANIPLADIQNTQSASIVVSNFSLEFSSVPEPSTVISLGLGLFFLFNRRSR